MRKITKQNLKELAKIMPVIDEKAQREYFGGSWYVNRHTGDEYGKVGTDDVIRTTDDFGYGKAKDDNSENEGMPLQGCDNWEKDIVFAQSEPSSISARSGRWTTTTTNAPCMWTAACCTSTCKRVRVTGDFATS